MASFFFRQIGFSYQDFRVFILIFSSSALCLVLARMQPVMPAKSVIHRAANLFLTFFILAVFLFEYFVIRIRAGFAIGIICYAIFFLTLSWVFLGRILACIFLVLAFFTHKSTTVILIVFLGMPFITAIWRCSPRIKSNLFTLASVWAVAYLLYTTNSSYEFRGEHIFSPLNPIRFFMISIVPLIIFSFIKNESKHITIDSSAIKEFPSYFVRLYAVLAVGLAVIFFAGLTRESGEALVRLYTLSSIPALLSFSICGSAAKAPISAYILVINALFFLVTVLMPGGAG